MTKAVQVGPTLDPLGECKCCRLPADVVRVWLKVHKISEEDVRLQRAVWTPKPGGFLRPISHLEIEEDIARRDPVFWAFLNFVERENGIDDATHEVLVERGEPWTLYPVQASLARLAGNIVVESASEVGKTRDLVLQALWRIDTQERCNSILIAGDTDNTLHKAWREIEHQLRENPRIGGGVVSSRVKPYRETLFANRKSLNMIMCGLEGQQFRGGHYDAVLADEVAKWKNPRQLSELWRGGKAGCEFRIYSTPDGDYSSPFYALCQRSVRVDGKGKAPRRLRDGHPDEPKFRKVNISRRDLPTWSAGRAAKYREQFGAETSVEWRNNVEGTWGSPSYSVFPMDTLKPCLAGAAELPHYRLVVAAIDRDRDEVILSAARLAEETGELVDGARQEEVIARERLAYAAGEFGGRRRSAGEMLAHAIAGFFPVDAVREWTTPELFAGCDLGSASEPTELVFARVVGEVWSDLFRLHLKFADPEKDHAAIFEWLDHVSGHQAKWGLDSGSFGNMLVSKLTASDRCCPACGKFLNFADAERLCGQGFGNYTDVVDIKTGEPVLDPDRRNAAGQFEPRRASNKEFGTQILERKTRAVEMRIAWDGGAGDPSLSGPQLLVNHTASGKNSKNERNFKGVDDHHVDARRQLALRVVRGLRRAPEALESPSFENVIPIGRGRESERVFGRGGFARVASASGGVASAFTAARPLSEF